jgi:hypothetical protein
MLEAESQVVLKTFTEHDFQDAFAHICIIRMMRSRKMRWAGHVEGRRQLGG